jgi:hypothetical protein
MPQLRNFLLNFLLYIRVFTQALNLAHFAEITVENLKLTL